jgi:hypothetical protein
MSEQSENAIRALLNDECDDDPGWVMDRHYEEFNHLDWSEVCEEARRVYEVLLFDGAAVGEGSLVDHFIGSLANAAVEAAGRAVARLIGADERGMAAYFATELASDAVKEERMDIDGLRKAARFMADVLDEFGK